jgi:hypothetical protein
MLKFGLFWQQVISRICELLENREDCTARFYVRWSHFIFALISYTDRYYAVVVHSNKVVLKEIPKTPHQTFKFTNLQGTI